MSLKTLQDCEKALRVYVPPPRSQRKTYNLRNMRAFMKAIGNPQNNYQVVHVAGTSGKTSTCYYLSALLSEAGLKTGLTVSPHITKISERAQIGTQPISDDTFAAELEGFLKIVAEQHIPLTYFEILMAFAYWYFDKCGVDVAVIETGLGGLLDGSNIVTHPSKVCVLTDIGLDHTAVLGKTIAQIAAQKAGIIGEQNEVFCWLQSNEVMAVFNNAVQSQRASLHTIERTKPSLPLDMPMYQKRNFSLALEAARWTLATRFHQKLKSVAAQNAVRVRIPARMESFIYKNAHITLDGAHNPQKMQAFVHSYKMMHHASPAVLFSCIQGPDSKIEDTISELVKLRPKQVTVTTFQSLQDMKKVSVDPHLVEKLLTSAGCKNVTITLDASAALEQLASTHKDIVVTGSLYLLFDIRRIIASN